MVDDHMANLMWIAAGGALGAVARYLVSLGMQSACPGFRPIGTMTVNVVGCLLVGIAVTWIVRSKVIGSPIHFFVVTGVLGGFTTFSAFGYETVSLLQERQIGPALVSVAGNLGLGLPAVLLGHKLVEWYYG